MATKKPLASDGEVKEAVDALLWAFGAPEDEAAAAGESGFAEAQPKPSDGEQTGVAPSGEVASLWGVSKPKKR